MIEAVGCTVYLKNRQKLNIINIYNPKGENKKIGKFIEEIVKTIPSCEKYIILGDLNAHNNIWCDCGISNSAGNSVEVFLQDNLDACLITPKNLKTRHCKRTNTYTTIDLSITPANIASKWTIWSASEITLLSDHLPVMHEIRDQPTKCENDSCRKQTNIKQVNWDKYQEILELQNLENTFVSSNNIEETIETFQNSLIQAADSTITNKTETHTTHKHNPWWNNICKEAKKQMTKAKRHYEAMFTFENYLHLQKTTAILKKNSKGRKI